MASLKQVDSDSKIDLKVTCYRWHVNFCCFMGGMDKASTYQIVTIPFVLSHLDFHVFLWH